MLMAEHVFHEHRVLTAALNDDGAEIRQLVAEMLPGERRAMTLALERVLVAIDEID